MRPLLSFLVLCFLSGCAAFSPRYPIAVIAGPSQDAQNLLKSGMRVAASAGSARLDFFEPAASPEEEAAQIEQAISGSPSALVISPLSPEAALPALRKAAAAGIPVVCLENCAGLEETVSAILPGPNHDAGSLSGMVASDRIQFQMDGKALVAILPCTSEPACGLREEEFNRRLMQLPQVGLVAGPPGADAAAVEQFLNETPGINLVWAAGEPETRAALAAVRSLGLDGKVLVLGVGLDSETAGQIGPEGGLEAVAAPLVYQAGQDAIGLALTLARGETPAAALRKSAVLVTEAQKDKGAEYLSSQGKMLLPTLDGSLPATGSGIKPSCECFNTPVPVTPTPAVIN